MKQHAEQSVPKAPITRKPRRPPPPWLRCCTTGCGARLARIDVVHGRTCIRTGPHGVSFGTQVLTCDICGQDREFVSMSII